MVKIIVNVGNVYTSKGKLFRGDTADLPETEINEINAIREDALSKVQVKAAPKRARKANGQLQADDPSTPDVNEAWVGGKAPTKKKAKSNGRAK